AFLGRDPLNLIGNARLPLRHDKAGPNAIDLVAAGLAAGEDRRLCRLDGDDFDLGITAAKAFGIAAQTSGSAYALHAGVEPAPGLGPGFLGHLVVSGDLIGVAHLVGPEGSGFHRNAPRRFDQLAGELLGHAPALAGYDSQLRPEKLHMVQLFPCESIGGHNVQWVSLDGAYHG